MKIDFIFCVILNMASMRLGCQDNIAETFTVRQLAEHQYRKLVVAGEVLDVTVAAIFADEIVEMVPIKEV